MRNLFSKKKGLSFKLGIDFEPQVDEGFIFSILESLVNRASAENVLAQVSEVTPISSFTTPMERLEETSLKGRGVRFGRDNTYATMNFDLLCHRRSGVIETTEYEGYVSFAADQAFRGQQVLHVPLGRPTKVTRC